jgi:hypothetical protein
MVPGEEARGLVAPRMAGNVISNCIIVEAVKHTTASLDGITALPDHGADGARVHVLNQTREERLASEVSVYENVRIS